MASVKLTEIIEKMKLDNLTPEIDISKTKITQPDINRPALQMAGYFEHYEATRLQMIGYVEYTYMLSLEPKRQAEIYEKLLSYPIPAIIFCRELMPDEKFLAKAKEKGVKISALSSFYINHTPELEHRFIGIHSRLAAFIEFEGPEADIGFFKNIRR